MINSLNVSFVNEQNSERLVEAETFNYPLATDLALLELATRLDELALVEIHDRYYKLVYRFIASKVGAGQLAEDYTSDVFVRFIRAIRQKSAPKNSLKGWLYRVASNIVNDHYRKQYRRSYSGLTETEVSLEKSPEDIMNSSINNKVLMSAVEQLGEVQQKVISLRFAFDMSVAEVASTLGKTESAIRQIQFRGIKKLAEIMGVERK